ncbi:hypothetical protein OG689_39095 [Kitasatospora sp. NBC_00240]|uniref:hypothetical protein n=1 Tax=Kitasatospora sp. NBC_00240 TaxID=2903567 RepID=UPI002257473B|nr:hypothetical protein [Kitasatospora sp. NBC_00240]MCX5215202.1 hypothetical protein [Kitasatospora sp. NBC_00240]
MTARLVAARLAGAAALLACSTLMSAPPASACMVSIGYKPSLDIADLRHHRTCSTGTSLAGAGGVAVLVLGALGVAGQRAYRRGEQAAGPEPDPTLAAYLDATGVTAQENGHGHGAP